MSVYSPETSSPDVNCTFFRFSSVSFSTTVPAAVQSFTSVEILPVLAPSRIWISVLSCQNHFFHITVLSFFFFETHNKRHPCGCPSAYDSRLNSALTSYTTGKATTNTAYLTSDSGCYWVKCGKVCSVQVYMKIAKRLQMVRLYFRVYQGRITLRPGNNFISHLMMDMEMYKYMKMI